MSVLQDWILNLIEMPLEVVNRKYSDKVDVHEELDSFPLPQTNGHTIASSHVDGEVLERLHHKIKEQTCEYAIWCSVVWYLAHALPIATAHELIDRSIAIFAMGMTRQVDEVQWRLATITEDALYTLIRERYVQENYSVNQFENMLKQYRSSIEYEGILHMLSFYYTESVEKEEVFKAAVVSREELLREKAEEDLEDDV
jgi:hypothetical protein